MRTSGHDMELRRARLKLRGSVSSHSGNRALEISTRGCYGRNKFSGFKGRMAKNLEEINRLGNQEIGTRENTARGNKTWKYKKKDLREQQRKRASKMREDIGETEGLI